MLAHLDRQADPPVTPARGPELRRHEGAQGLPDLLACRAPVLEAEPRQIVRIQGRGEVFLDVVVHLEHTPQAPRRRVRDDVEALAAVAVRGEVE